MALYRGSRVQSTVEIKRQNLRSRMNPKSQDQGYHPLANEKVSPHQWTNEKKGRKWQPMRRHQHGSQSEIDTYPTLEEGENATWAYIK